MLKNHAWNLPPLRKSSSSKNVLLGIKWNTQIYSRSQLSNFHPIGWKWRVWGQVPKYFFCLEFHEISRSAQNMYFFGKFTPTSTPKGWGSMHDFFVQALIFYAIISKKCFGTWHIPQSPWNGRLQTWLFIHIWTFHLIPRSCLLLKINFTRGRAEVVGHFPYKSLLLGI